MSAQPIELSQSQLRDLVHAKQVLSAEVVINDVARNYGGTVMDLRGFSLKGATTYRVLVQRDDGNISELLIDAEDGGHLDPATPMGQVISSVARSVP